MPNTGLLLEQVWRPVDAGSVSSRSLTESTLSVLVEGFEMTDYLPCHFERIARNLFSTYFTVYQLNCHRPLLFASDNPRKKSVTSCNMRFPLCNPPSGRSPRHARQL